MDPALAAFALSAGLSFAFFLIAGWFLRRLGVFPDDDTGRYFLLHVLCNGYVTARHLDDVISSYRFPTSALRMLPTDTSGTAVIFGLHLYHLIFFQPLPAVDWIHHIVMIVIMLPLAVGLNAGPLLGHGAFFASGLPGGLDYLMLVMVKWGWIKSIDEKRLNSLIQTWIRAPGCLYHALFVWIGYVSDLDWCLEHSYLPAFLVRPALFIVIATYFWNAMFFQRRVVENYAIKGLSKAKH